MPAATELTFDQAYDLAQRCAAAGDLPQAEHLCRRILDQSPSQPQALRLLAYIATKSHRLDIAIQCLLRCAAVLPEDADLRLDLGNALLAAGRTEEAAAAYRAAIQFNPQNPAAEGNLGIALCELGQLNEAIAHLQSAVALDPTRPEFLNNLGHALSTAGRFEPAIATLRQAIQLHPTWLEPAHNLAHAFKGAGLVEDAIKLCREILAAHPSAAAGHSTLLSLLLNRPESSPQQILDAHRAWSAAHSPASQPQPVQFPNEPKPDRKLRVGYVSPSLQDHEMAYFVEYLLACHDSANFEVFCYADLLRRPSPSRERLKTHAGQWRDITGLSDAQVFALIREDAIDLLIDLAGHAPGNRLSVFAQRPAPVQLIYLGYPATTGLDCFDGYLTDAVADPPGSADPFYTEPLIRLPRTFVCYRPPVDAPSVQPAPILKRQHITFGAFANLSQVNNAAAGVWASILQLVPASRLLIQSAGVEDPLARRTLLGRFRDFGIEDDRLDLRAEATIAAERCATRQLVDIALDPFPYQQFTATCESLWMGVPVITLPGGMHASRISASVLSQVGLSSLTAESAKQYIRLATGLAADVPRLVELRKSLRDRMKQSPLMAGIQFARDVEREYRRLWQRWCDENRGNPQR